MKGLRAIRKKRGLTLKEVEEITGIDANTISRYERGVISPTTITVAKIAEKLGVRVDELMNEPQGNQIQIVISWDSKELKEGNINMNEHKFKLILGEDGTIGVSGAALFKDADTIEEFIANFRRQVEIAYETQVRRGALQLA